MTKSICLHLETRRLDSASGISPLPTCSPRLPLQVSVHRPARTGLLLLGPKSPSVERQGAKSPRMAEDVGHHPTVLI